MTTSSAHTIDRNSRSPKIVNVAFSYNVYSLVKEFVANKKIDEEVEFALEEMHLGPIEFSSVDSRREWLNTHVGVEVKKEQLLAAERTYFALREWIHRGVSIVAWVDVNDSAEYANFLYWIDRCDPKTFLMARPDFPGHGNFLNFESDPEKIMNSIRHSAELIRLECVEGYRRQWARLKSENSAFRLFDAENVLKSFAIDAFDEVLTSSIRTDWEAMPKILLRAIRKCWADGHSIPGDLVFSYRIIQLAKNSTEMEMRGDSSDPMRLEFRVI
ncbi:DUF3658 domain-containing protein [Trinickia mobilis]|uniref:DUF3658 domain-containing protein n=1 Tax=Trinickia mobilis TaxID=2816356 RepID=UPI001A8D3FED|nr:DUF3658 domain-containing protein [Trinickia mobilis]